MGEQRRADLAGERSGVDDAPQALRHEMPGDNLIGQEHAPRIDGEIEIPVRVGQLERAPHGRHARVGDEDFAAAQLRQRRVESALDRSALAYVDLDGDRAAADLMRSSPAGLDIDVGDRRPCSASDQRGRDGAADALRAAGDERALADELGVRLTRDRHSSPKHEANAPDSPSPSPLPPGRG